MQMNCRKCGAVLSEGVKFCSKCGQKVADDSPKTIQLKCRDCGGIMTSEEENTILCCPYCGSKELIPESDDVKIERIKSQTYKDIELEKIKYMSEKEKRESDREQEKEREQERKRFSKSKFSKFLLILALICLFSMFSAFSSRSILSGIIALIQVGLFVAAWLMGMGFVKEKIPRLHVLLEVIGFFLIILFFKVKPVKLPGGEKEISKSTAQQTVSSTEDTWKSSTPEEKKETSVPEESDSEQESTSANASEDGSADSVVEERTESDNSADGSLVESSSDEAAETEENVVSKKGIRPEFQKAMDEYVKFFEDYAAFLKKYAESDNMIALMGEYLSYMEQYTEMMEALDKVGEEDLSEEELELYLETMLKIQTVLLE